MAPAEITFAIPFYGSSTFLAHALNSVVAQSRSTWRCIVVDDCSPESDAAAVAAKYDDPRITYVRNECNLGIGPNWNRCLALADTELVVLLHGDDALLPNYAHVMLDLAARRADSAIYYCQAEIIDERAQPTFSFADWYKRFLDPALRVEADVAGEPGLSSLLEGFFIICPTMCYRRSRLEEADLHFSETRRQVLDMELVTSLLLRGGVVTGSPHCAYQYRRHSANQTAQLTRDLSRFKEEIALYEALAHQAQARGWRRATQTADRKMIIIKNLAFCALKELSGGRVDAAQRTFMLLGEVLKSGRARNEADKRAER